MKCHHCGFDAAKDLKIGRQDMCPKCGTALHCCLNCRFYAESVHHQCREEQAEFVNDKSGANICDCFEPGDSGAIKSDTQRELARKKLEDLFKK